MNKIIVNIHENGLIEADEALFGKPFQEQRVRKRLHHQSIKNEFKQTLIWRLERKPLSSDIHVIDSFLKSKGFKFMKTAGTVLHYRLFKEEDTCTHVKIAKRYFGAIITCHDDFEIHGKFDHLPENLALLSELYVLLSKQEQEVFLIPRQKASYQGYLSSLHSQGFLDRKKRK